MYSFNSCEWKLTKIYIKITLIIKIWMYSFNSYEWKLTKIYIKITLINMLNKIIFIFSFSKHRPLVSISFSIL